MHDWRTGLESLFYEYDYFLEPEAVGVICVMHV